MVYHRVYSARTYVEGSILEDKSCGTLIEAENSNPKKIVAGVWYELHNIYILYVTRHSVELGNLLKYFPVRSNPIVITRGSTGSSVIELIDSF